jgi:outer membrane lipoprotein SlyB
MRSVLIVPAIVLALGGCVSPSKNTYNAADVGRMIETTEGRVVSSRIVRVNEDPRGYGTAAGAAIGATGAGLTIGSGSGSLVAALIGGIVGAGAGYLTEQQMRGREGIEYMVRTPDGRTRTLVQNREGSEEPIPAGAPVLIQYGGNYTRIIEKPRGAEDSWQDPDAGGGGGTGGAGGAVTSSGPKGPGGAGTPMTESTPPQGNWPYSGDPGRYGTIRPRQQ